MSLNNDDDDFTVPKLSQIKAHLTVRPTDRTTYRNVHQILKHIVLSQKNAARNEKCIVEAAEELRRRGMLNWAVARAMGI